MRMQSKVVLLAAMLMVLTGEQNTFPIRFAYMACGCFVAMGLLWVQRTQHGHFPSRATGVMAGYDAGLLERQLPEVGKHWYQRTGEDRALENPSDTTLAQTFRQRATRLEQVHTRLQEEFEHFQSEQTRRLAAEQWKTLRQFSAGLGRELNNPVSVLLSNLDYLQQRLTALEEGNTPELRQELTEALADARTVAGRIHDVTADLELLATPTDLELEPVDVVATLRCAVEAAAPVLQSQTRLVQELGEVPRVSGDMGRLYKVFLRLLLHAARTPGMGQAGERELHLRVRMGEASQVVVELGGPGHELCAPGQSSSFQPFCATGGAAKQPGLELSVCHGIVTALGGSLSLVGQGGQKSLLRVCLPCHAAV